LGIAHTQIHRIAGIQILGRIQLGMALHAGAGPDGADAFQQDEQYFLSRFMPNYCYFFRVTSSVMSTSTSFPTTPMS
jgi:hypothetical protein